MKTMNKTISLLVTGAAVLSINNIVAKAEGNNTNGNNAGVVPPTGPVDPLLGAPQPLGGPVKNLPIEYENKTETDVIFDGTYDEKDQAEKREQEKVEEYENEGYEDIKSEITTIEDTEGHLEFDKLVVDTDAYVDLTEEEANEMKAELEKDINVTVTITEGKDVFDHNDISTFSQKFKTIDEAKAYIQSLEEEGYTVTEIKYDFDEDTQDGNLSGTFDTLEEAIAALDEFKKEYTTEATEKDIVKIADTTEDKADTYSETFDEEKDADEYKDQEEAKTTDDVIYTADKKTNVGETETLDESYEDEDEAKEAKKDFEDSHDVVEDSSLTKRQTGTVYAVKTITKDQTTYVIERTTYVIIKQGNEFIVWTPAELTLDQKKLFIETYKDFEDNVIKASKLKTDKFVFGYDTKNFTSNKKLFSFRYEGETTYMDIDHGAKSRVVVGDYTPVNTYDVLVNAHNLSYTVNVNKLTKGYDYQINATGTKTITLASGTVSGTKTKPVYKKLRNLTVATKTYKTVYDDDYKLIITGKKKAKLENPNTVDHISYSILVLLSSAVLMVSSALNLTKKENK